MKRFYLTKSAGIIFMLFIMLFSCTQENHNENNPPNEVATITVTLIGTDGKELKVFNANVGEKILLDTVSVKNLSHWNTKADGTGESYKGAAVFTESVTLYAILLAEKKITITFDTNGADEATPQAIETTSGKSIELPELGDNFSHWNTKADGTGESYKGAAVFTESVTLYAILLAEKKITITFDPNGADEATPQAIETTSGKSIELPELGDNFSHWNTKADGTGDSYKGAATFTESVTLYAILLAEKKITITFAPNGVTEAAPQAIEAISGKSIELPELGSNFSHWNTKADGTGELYKGAAVFTESVTLYAILLAEKEIITITFEPNGGSGTMEPMKVLPYESLLIPECTFTKENYIFKEWNTKTDGTGSSYYNRSNIRFSADTTLYAIWAEIEIGFDVKQPDNNEYAHISQEQTENTVIFKCNQYNSDYDSYTWYIDGEKQNETSDTFTVDTSKMKAGLYTVMVKVKYNGKYYSDTTTFSVKKQAGGK